MIDRTTLDLRLADYRSTTARIEASGWQYRRATPHRSGRTHVIAALVTLGARLAQAAIIAAHVTRRQPGRDAA
jgi:hypothetical protein